MKKKTTLGILALLVITLVAATGIASAFGDRFFEDGMDNEAGEKIRQAVESGDYEAWKEAMSELISEENFNKLVERHKAMSEKMESMKEPKENMEEMKKHMEEVNQALEAVDYNAWKSAVENCKKCPKMDESITEENFDTFVKLYQARKNNDWETAKKLEEELGIEKRFGHNGPGRNPFRPDISNDVK